MSFRGALGMSSALAVLALVGACGLVDPNVTNFDLTLPSKTYSLDTMQYGSGQVVGAACGAVPMTCETLAKNACEGGTCEGACDGGKCTLTVHVSKWKAVDLVNEKSELATIQDQPILDVTVDDITYTVTENSLNIATPPFKIYVAPMTVMTPNNTEAKQIGVIPAVAPGTTPGPADVQLGKDGRSILAMRMGDYRTPFNIIVAADLVVTPGTPVPTGKITANINVKAHAGL